MNKISDIVYLNGCYVPISEAKISVLDRGFMFADSVYEVIPVYGGALFRQNQHIDRLLYSLHEIHITPPYDAPAWLNLCAKVIEKNAFNNGHLYIQLTRGSPPSRSHTFNSDLQPTILIMCQSVDTPDLASLDNEMGISAITTNDIRWHRCDIKSTALLPNVLIRQQAKDKNAAEAIMIKDGLVTEGAASNVFIIKGNKLLTPPKSNHVLGGTTRDLVLELASTQKLTSKTAKIPLLTLETADEIWVTSSTMGIIPVVSLNDKLVGDGKPGPFWRKIAQCYANYRQNIIEDSKC